jgi:hypothetical protein
MMMIAIGDKGNFRYDEGHVVSYVFVSFIENSSKWMRRGGILESWERRGNT